MPDAYTYITKFKLHYGTSNTLKMENGIIHVASIYCAPACGYRGLQEDAGYRTPPTCFWCVISV